MPPLNKHPRQPLRWIDTGALSAAVTAATVESVNPRLTIGDISALLVDMVEAVREHDPRLPRQILVDAIKRHIAEYYPTQPIAAEEIAP